MPAVAERRQRIDRLLVDRGLVESRTRAQALLIAGAVVVDGQRVDKAGALVALDADVRVRGHDHPYVSRGGVKLQGALEHFGAAASSPPLVIEGRVAMDIGASTGGFTDCLLQRGALRVHAVDVGYGQLAWKLASDARVVVHDRSNIRTLEPTRIGEPVELCVIDCSFIALAKVLPSVPAFLAPGADVIALVKPQFELDPARVGKGGIVRDDDDRRDALAAAEAAAAASGLVVLDHCESPIAGKTGNREWFTWLRWPGPIAPAGRVPSPTP
ncbi:MAG: TlyA family RNA methyltransferase [Deltaproteobacteria bacterium]|nr:TlyA family RNA methyltransferase [Deltaproteobacteria bacterium]MBK8715501.1 TlyA family RNA methyltransferase [Deltaproteobacteria bacterium]